MSEGSTLYQLNFTNSNSNPTNDNDYSVSFPNSRSIPAQSVPQVRQQQSLLNNKEDDLILNNNTKLNTNLHNTFGFHQDNSFKYFSPIHSNYSQNNNTQIPRQPTNFQNQSLKNKFNANDKGNDSKTSFSRIQNNDQYDSFNPLQIKSNPQANNMISLQNKITFIPSNTNNYNGISALGNKSHKENLNASNLDDTFIELTAKRRCDHDFIKNALKQSGSIISSNVLSYKSFFVQFPSHEMAVNAINKINNPSFMDKKDNPKQINYIATIKSKDQINDLIKIRQRDLETKFLPPKCLCVHGLDPRIDNISELMKPFNLEGNFEIDTSKDEVRVYTYHKNAASVKDFLNAFQDNFSGVPNTYVTEEPNRRIILNACSILKNRLINDCIEDLKKMLAEEVIIPAITDEMNIFDTDTNLNKMVINNNDKSNDNSTLNQKSRSSIQNQNNDGIQIFQKTNENILQNENNNQNSKSNFNKNNTLPKQDNQFPVQIPQNNNLIQFHQFLQQQTNFHNAQQFQQPSQNLIMNYGNVYYPSGTYNQIPRSSFLLSTYSNQLQIIQPNQNMQMKTEEPNQPNQKQFHPQFQQQNPQQHSNQFEQFQQTQQKQTTNQFEQFQQQNSQQHSNQFEQFQQQNQFEQFQQTQQKQTPNQFEQFQQNPQQHSNQFEQFQQTQQKQTPNQFEQFQQNPQQHSNQFEQFQQQNQFEQFQQTQQKQNPNQFEQFQQQNKFEQFQQQNPQQQSNQFEQFQQQNPQQQFTQLNQYQKQNQTHFSQPNQFDQFQQQPKFSQSTQFNQFQPTLHDHPLKKHTKAQSQPDFRPKALQRNQHQNHQSKPKSRSTTRSSRSHSQRQKQKQIDEQLQIEINLQNLQQRLLSQQFQQQQQQQQSQRITVHPQVASSLSNPSSSSGLPENGRIINFYLGSRSNLNFYLSPHVKPNFTSLVKKEAKHRRKQLLTSASSDARNYEREMSRKMENDTTFESIKQPTLENNSSRLTPIHKIEEWHKRLYLRPYATMRRRKYILARKSGLPILKSQFDDNINESSAKKGVVGKRVYFEKSEIQGYGLFALEPISSKDFICEYTGQLIRMEVADRREKKLSKKGFQHMYLFRMGEYVIDATQHGSNARFLNHSCSPNCKARQIEIKDMQTISFFASKSIKPHDEIAFDYEMELERDPSKWEKCYCGSKDCNGYLNYSIRRNVLNRMWMQANNLYENSDDSA